MEYGFEQVGRRLRDARKRGGMTQEALGEACGLHPSYIGQIERGERQPTLETLANISRALDTPLEFLVRDAPDDREPVRSEIDLLLSTATDDQLELLLRLARAVVGNTRGGPNMRRSASPPAAPDGGAKSPRVHPTRR